MAGITLAQAEAKLQTWMDADDKLAGGQSYTINGHSFNRAETEKKIMFWNNMVQRLSRGGTRVRQITPVSN